MTFLFQGKSPLKSPFREYGCLWWGIATIHNCRFASNFQQKVSVPKPHVFFFRINSKLEFSMSGNFQDFSEPQAFFGAKKRYCTKIPRSQGTDGFLSTLPEVEQLNSTPKRSTLATWGHGVPWVVWSQQFDGMSSQERTMSPVVGSLKGLWSQRRFFGIFFFRDNFSKSTKMPWLFRWFGINILWKALDGPK